MEIKNSLNYTYILYNYNSTLFDGFCFLFPFFMINSSSVCKKSRKSLSDPGSRREENEVAIMDVLVDGIFVIRANVSHQQK
jgi:hypothetical protein